MRKSLIVVGLLGVLLFAVALPALASDGELLGSGAVAPESGDLAVAPVDSAAAVAEVTPVSQAAGEDVLAATGFDASVALLLGLGLMTAGGAAVHRTQARQVVADTTSCRPRRATL